MRPRRARGKTYLRDTVKISPFCYIIEQDRDLGLDLQTVSRMLLTRWNVDESGMKDWYGFRYPEAGLASWYHCRNRSVTQFGWFPALDELVYGLLQCHFLENQPLLRDFLKYMEHLDGTQPYHFKWKKDLQEHLKKYKPNLETQHRLHLYSGGHPYSLHGRTDPQFCIEPCFIALWSENFFPHLQSTLFETIRLLRAAKPVPKGNPILNNVDNVSRTVPHRRHSLPPAGTRCSALWRDRYILFPRRPLSDIDKLARRRSLSRSHIRAMFRDRSPTMADSENAVKPQIRVASGNRCRNCTKRSHRTERCPSNCGHCNSDEHKADACPVKPINRCKCQPFPQFHTVSNCFMRCSRACGSPYLPGHFKHKNAMLCSHRCCMCGLRGHHNGRKCKLKRCRCGEQHLTQDCRWKVECPGKSCDRYLCTEHCRECGRARNKESKEYFVGMTCPQCLQNSNPVMPKAE